MGGLDGWQAAGWRGVEACLTGMVVLPSLGAAKVDSCKLHKR